MRNSTLLFLIKEQNDQITDICLAMKKRGFGVGRYNGVGGKLEEGETLEQAVIRETREEIFVLPKVFRKVSELAFTFPHNPTWDQLVHVYFCTDWDGNPTESEEMKPGWFSVQNIPYDTMWPDDIYWLPRTLSHELLKARFTFGEGDIVLDQEIYTVSSLDR